MDRRTITTLMENVKPVGTERGHPVYALRDAAIPIAHWLEGQDPVAMLRDGDEIDPRMLPPRERDWFYSSEKSRIAAERESGMLCPAPDVEQEYRALVAPMAQMLETLPDLLERDADLSPHQIELVRRICDDERNRCAMLAAE